MFKLTNSEQSLKMFSFFEFSGSYKNIVVFWDFSLGLSLYYIFCFSSDLNLQKKQLMNAV